MNIYIIVIVVLYIFAGYSYLSGIVEMEKIASEINTLGDQVKIEATPLTTPILDKGVGVKILIVLAWPLLALAGMYLVAKQR